MKIFNKLAESFIDIVRTLLLIAILILLIFIIQWRMGHLFSLAGPKETREDVTLQEEIVASKEKLDEIRNATQESTVPTKLFTVSSINVNDVALTLEKNHYIKSAHSFIDKANRTGVNRYFTQGTFDIPEGATDDEILNILTTPGIQAAQRTVQIEIPENANDESIADIVAKEGLVEDRGTFLEMIRRDGAVPKIKPGGYLIHAPIGSEELLKELTKYQDSMATEELAPNPEIQ